jgi:hypothetical protein
MSTVNKNINIGGVPNLQDLLDAVPADRMVSCLPRHESLILHDGEKELGRIPIDGVLDVLLIDDSKVQKRYSIGLSLVLGPLVLLFPKKTIREAYRLCIQWKDPMCNFHFTYIRMARRIMADHSLKTIKHALIPETRKELARRASKAGERTGVAEKYQSPAEASPLITCRHCTMEFRKADLPHDGKCPVCGQSLNVNAN